MTKRKGLVIAMDGPAGVGKSTVGGLVAKRLGYKFINTGEMYRALTWKALEEGLDLNDNEEVLSMAKGLLWEFKPVEEVALPRSHRIRLALSVSGREIVVDLLGARSKEPCFFRSRRFPQLLQYQHQSHVQIFLQMVPQELQLWKYLLVRKLQSVCDELNLFLMEK